jgi:hypothetical protein
LKHRRILPYLFQAKRSKRDSACEEYARHINGGYRRKFPPARYLTQRVQIPNRDGAFGTKDASFQLGKTRPDAADSQKERIMVHNDKSAPETIETSKYKLISLVEARYPERAGLIRRIHPLFPGHFRVNFHEVDRGNTVSSSYFVAVNGDSVVELN